MPNHGDEEEVEEEEGCEEVIRISFDISATPLWCFAKAAGQKSGRFAFGRGSPTGPTLYVHEGVRRALRRLPYRFFNQTGAAPDGATVARPTSLGLQIAAIFRVIRAAGVRRMEVATIVLMSGFLVGIAGFLLAVRSEVQLKAERAWMRATLTQLRLTIPAAEPRTRKALDDMLEEIEHRK